MTEVMTTEVLPGRCPEPGRRRQADRHYQAVLCAEARRLATELRFSGPMRRSTLARRCQTNRWSEGSLDAAVQAGIRKGTLRRLPFGFIDIERPHPMPPQPRPTAGEVRVDAGVPGPGRAHPQPTAANGPSERSHRSRSLQNSNGTREAEPLILILLGVAMPIALVAWAAVGGGIALLVIAITVMLAGIAGIGIFVRRLTENPPAAKDTGQSRADGP